MGCISECFLGFRIFHPEHHLCSFQIPDAMVRLFRSPIAGAWIHMAWLHVWVSSTITNGQYSVATGLPPHRFSRLQKSEEKAVSTNLLYLGGSFQSHSSLHCRTNSGSIRVSAGHLSPWAGRFRRTNAMAPDLHRLGNAAFYAIYLSNGLPSIGEGF